MRNVSLLVFVFILLITQGGSAQTVEAPVAGADAKSETSKKAVLSFLEWKAERVADAQKKLEQIAKGTDAADWQEGKSGTPDTKTQEQKLIFNVDVALQLNIHDYFSMYLKSLNLEDFSEATKKLTPTESSELLLAYKASLEKDKKNSPKMTKISKDNAKSKNQEIQ